MKKHLIIVTGMMTMIILGTVYSWSVFRVALEKELALTTLESGLPYMSSLFFYAVAMFFSRRFITPQKIRPVLITGAILVGSGWLLAGYIFNPYMLSIVMGVLIGTGVGLIYNIPLVLVPYWHEKNNGFIVGIILLGFGLSPFVSARIATGLISEYGIFTSFKIIGGSYMILLLALGFSFSFPDKTGIKDYRTIKPGEAFSNKSFRELYIYFFIAVSIGLMMIGLSSNIGSHYVDVHPRLTSYITIFAIFNGIGRPLYGLLLDKFDKKKIMLFSFLQILSALLLLIITGNESTYLISFSIFWFNLGGWLSIGPNITLSYFGKELFSSYYGILFTAYGIAALLGNLFAGVIMDYFNHPKYLFSTLVILILATILKVLSDTKKRTS